jgi:ketosteroid isomerase-like protein
MERFQRTTRECPDCEDAFAAMGRGDRQGLLALYAGDFELIMPGEHGASQSRSTLVGQTIGLEIHAGLKHTPA